MTRYRDSRRARADIHQVWDFLAIILYYVFERGIEIAALVHAAPDLEGLFRRGEL